MFSSQYSSRNFVVGSTGTNIHTMMPHCIQLLIAFVKILSKRYFISVFIRNCGGVHAHEYSYYNAISYSAVITTIKHVILDYKHYFVIFCEPLL